MKSLQIIVFGAVMAMSSTALLGQDRPKKIETTTFEVSGVCKMCEQRIEQAALVKGVKFADWDRTTGMIKVMYKTNKTDIHAVHEAIAGIGHDTSELEATEEAYGDLPDCCRYRDGVEVH